VLDPIPECPAVALCGIARPERFWTALQKMGVPLVECVSLGDHSPKIGNAVQKFLQAGHPVIVTEKDAVKLEPNLRKRVLVAKLAVRSAPEIRFI
jgi:tetraacyldisaccharide 4'-kinase